MSIKQRIGKYLRDKLGITEMRNNLERKIDYLTSYINLIGNEEIHMAEETKEKIAKRLELEDTESIDWAIHKNDLMFHHQLGASPGDSEDAFYKYFYIGRTLIDYIGKISRQQGLKPESILDFGGGYGRVARFFPQEFPGSRVVVSEVKEQAMIFQKTHFGFETIIHSEAPESFPESTFDLIVAISVFTHLPEKGIKNWLQKLYENLNPGGAILFTINNIKNCWYPHNGRFFYTIKSEDSGFPGIADRLKDEEAYGTAFLSHDYLIKLLNIPEAEVSFHEDFPAYQEAVLIRKK